MGVCISNTSLQNKIEPENTNNVTENYTHKHNRNSSNSSSSSVISIECSNTSTLKSYDIVKSSKPILLKLQSRRASKIH